ncbi:uncharacterized protein LOC6581827 [Drosophila mojavensis]|uniref:Uncharacterized protein, isoform A n=1 Tax=Drosophila mojavensis TaxID=7230 RepID=B4L079_DROMO|nr:uncharacterized protein LOC6581827 [Drosophila mojavensis]XP_015017560.1 uncharacterized protein LOC6581827 [Drosophila mojavensis]XP_043865699.1 uncharacterized protein LOC6581827 [Drosophila mojavensis]EDW18025.1 uncharacterized protein Dmoj_GI12325, isoform A [Drosophila mojavensis]KRG05908.1 uncharacterized protein Dmoj_GI12325, isoform B [Drosophila mojavensis]KRG05909.1 uncharacterized protein Dmoj_GI12325, isoform C [Drosophila mojavensis]
MNKLRTLLPGQHAKDTSRNSVALEPEIGFQITIETHDPKEGSQQSFSASNSTAGVPELNVHLIAARHLPSLFGFKIVQGYLIKVKLFPGTKRLDSSVQTNTWPKFNENFKFPLVPDIKPSLKHGSAFSSRRQVQRRASGDISAPEELFAGQFVVFTVYALLELPAASFNRFNKTYRSLKDKSSTFVQRLSSGEVQTENGSAQKNGKNKKTTENPRDAMPPLTISESRRNIGSVTCYLEPKLFKRNSRTGCYSTEELWLPIKDITTTVSKTTPSNNNNNSSSSGSNNLTNAPKGVVELALEVRDLSESEGMGPSPQPTETKDIPVAAGANNWQRMTAEVKRKMGISNVGNGAGGPLMLRVTTSRMRCSNKVKDELEATAGGGVYVKTTVFEHGIYVDAWKSPVFFPSLSTKWDGSGGDEATICMPLRSLDQLENIVIRITLATKLKMAKKLVLGTVIVSGANNASESGMEQLRLLRESPLNERVATWHCYH